jgi:hypothetical protein
VPGLGRPRRGRGRPGRGGPEVSGATAIAERKLERLLQRVEAGESEGIITPYLDRFGRDLIEGALAYRRLKLAGGRLICVNDGIDSERPGDEFQFQIRLVFAEDYLRRTRSNFQGPAAFDATESATSATSATSERKPAPDAALTSLCRLTSASATCRRGRRVSAPVTHQGRLGRPWRCSGEEWAVGRSGRLEPCSCAGRTDPGLAHSAGPFWWKWAGQGVVALEPKATSTAPRLLPSAAIFP